MSSQKPVHQPQHQAEHDAQNDAGSKRKKDCCVLPTVADVAGQASERHVGAPGEQDDKADQDQQSPCANEQLTQRVHGFIL